METTEKDLHEHAHDHVGEGEHADHQDHGHEHDHTHAHGDHSHSHGKTPVVMFFIGLAAFIAGLFLPEKSLVQNILFIASTLTAGYHIIGEGFGDTFRETIAQKKFMPNIHILMTLAALGASIIGNFEEAALLILIFAGAHFLEDYAEGRSKREITSLLKMNPKEARLLMENGETKIVPVTDLKIGDRLKVLNGDQIPTDGMITEGFSDIDEASINGESMPREKSVGDEVFGSTMNGNGSFTMEVTKDTKDTVFAKIMDMVNQSQSNMSKTATKIQQIEPKYVTAVMIIVPIFIVGMHFLMSWDWYTSFYRGMVFLISASPCALAASAIPATLSAISNLAKRGVLFKGGSYLSNLSDIKAVTFDKTGTLTEGKPVVTGYWFENPAEEQGFIDLIVAMEKTANHPLADAILNKFDSKNDVTLEVTNELGKGLVAKYNGDTYQLGKPSLFTDDQLADGVLAHNDRHSAEGKTVVYFAKNNQVIGLIAMMDIPNENAKPVIDYLRTQGVHTTMITGDAEATGKAVGDMIGIDEVIGNVMPENKSEIVAEQQEKYGAVAMLGDGVNDAPALVKSDIGVAMGEGTDIAIDVADAVLMQNDLKKFSYAHQTSKRLDKIVMQNIIFSMFIVVLLVVLNILGKMEITIGVLAHEGSTILVLFNGLRMLIPTRMKEK